MRNKLPIIGLVFLELAPYYFFHINKEAFYMGNKQILSISELEDYYSFLIGGGSIDR